MARIDIYVQPRATRSEVAGLHDGVIKIRLAAAPVDGAANDALVEFLADLFRVRKSSVRIVAGHSSRRKVVEIDGVDEATATAALRTPPNLA